MEKNLICKSCGFTKVNEFLDLGSMPPVNAFITKEEIDNEKSFPLKLAYCPSCHLVQLTDIVPPEDLFRNYHHLSAGSQTNVAHLKEVAELLEKFNPTPKTKILEIGSNDGTLLKFLKKHTEHVLGVDPAKNLIELNKEKGVDYIPEFFTTSLTSEILSERGKYDFIVALNVIPHTPNNIELLKASKMLLNDDGMLIMEGVYALETILNGEFDTIYHEHVYTFSLHSLISTFSYGGLKIIDAEKIPTQGGSLRIYAKKMEHAKEYSQNVKKILEEEINKGLKDFKIYSGVKEKVERFKSDLKKLIGEHKGSQRIIGLGAPARGMVICNYCGLNNKDIEYVIDDTHLKHNKLTPGTHIPVKSWDELDKYQGQTFLLLSWNYKENMIERLKKKVKSFKVIIPFPKLEVLEFG